jgi:hypothetical protein
MHGCKCISISPFLSLFLPTITCYFVAIVLILVDVEIMVEVLQAQHRIVCRDGLHSELCVCVCMHACVCVCVCMCVCVCNTDVCIMYVCI